MPGRTEKRLYLTLQKASGFGPWPSDNPVEFAELDADSSVPVLRIGDQMPTLRKVRELRVGDGIVDRMPEYGERHDSTRIVVVRVVSGKPPGGGEPDA